VQSVALQCRNRLREGAGQLQTTGGVRIVDHDRVASNVFANM
jgi:hypothetical protein